jgi:hypothetical protein
MTPPLRVRSARLAVSLSALLVVVAATGGCGARSGELRPGSYRATLESPGGELPFGLDVAQEEEGFVLYLVNGEDRTQVPAVTVTEGRLTATLPGDAGTLTAEIRGGTLRGEVSLPGAGGEAQVLPFRAESGQAWRFFEQASTDNADVAGRWAVTITRDTGEQAPGMAEFAQSFERVTGTIATPAGSSGVLAGEMRGDELYLSRFDGTVADLCKARVDAEGDLVGECWSATVAHRTFRAERNPEAALATSDPGAASAPIADEEPVAP